MNPLNLKNKIIVALDVDDDETAMKLLKSLSPFAGGFKIGPRLTNRYGPDLVKKIALVAPLFIDHKYYDIPSTMVSAVKSCFDLGASLVTVHASSGNAALSELSKLEYECSLIRPFKVLAVTILTSIKASDQPAHLHQIPLALQIDELAEMATKSGIQGLVCSPAEVRSLRAKYPLCTIVTPGIRSVSIADDQARVGTAKDAAREGASYLVVGRPIIESLNPVEALKSFIEESS